MEFSSLVVTIILAAIVAGVLRRSSAPSASQEMRAEMERARAEARQVRAKALAQVKADNAAFMSALDADMASYRQRQRRVGFLPGIMVIDDPEDSDRPTSVEPDDDGAEHYDDRSASVASLLESDDPPATYADWNVYGLPDGVRHTVGDYRDPTYIARPYSSHGPDNHGF